MNNLEKRIQSLEELIFRVVLQTKAETMAIRDILIEKNLASSERWDELVKDHKMSFSSFKVVTEMENKDSPQGSSSRGQER